MEVVQVPPTDNFWKTKLTPTNHISLEREFIEESSPIHLENILITRLYEQFSRNEIRNGSRKNFRLLEYEHIIYHFKAHDLEIPFIWIVSRNI